MAELYGPIAVNVGAVGGTYQYQMVYEGRSLSGADSGLHLVCDSDMPIALTVPQGISTRHSIYVVRIGSGAVSLVADFGVLLDYDSENFSAGVGARYQLIELIPNDVNRWTLRGNLAPITDLGGRVYGVGALRCGGMVASNGKRARNGILPVVARGAIAATGQITRTGSGNITGGGSANG